MGWFSSLNECYWRLMEPQPSADDPMNKLANGYPTDGSDTSKGKFYRVTCPDIPGQNRVLLGGDFWRASPPPGFGGGPDVAALAQQAVTKMRLEGANVGIAPKPDSKGGSVGLPVWVWNGKGARTTGPTSASATALGVTVTATAHVQSVAWNFGNGTSVACAFPGVPYAAAYGTSVPAADSGQCGFAGYARTGTYTVTATSTWAVHWVGGGQQGDLTTTRTSQVQIRIGEVQVVGQ
ncbi:ATP/GTP-binding protein [Actinacidiphila rubida]|uniref:ATP/GTP-binding protein n=1 Tax=Actinacidiphila rubida TaxID=310780 RepID=UPI0011606421|nr:ATP/GTP-binding protein [Actinacidiphila rubida]